MSQLNWVNKYKVDNFHDIIGNDDKISLIKKLLDNKSLPHLIFYGKICTFKSTTVTSIVNYIYGKPTSMNMLKLTASDDRGINSVREEIKCFAEKINILDNVLQLIVLDDIDSMTYDAQSALRRIIEIYSNNVRFCLLCNNKCKIIHAIKARCLMIKFKLPSTESIHNILNNILIKEKKEKYKKILNDIIFISDNDLRRSINNLQLCTYNSSISSKFCYNLNGYPSINTMKKIFDIIEEDNMYTAYVKIKNIIIENNINLSNLISSLLTYIITYNEKYIKPSIIKDIGKLEKLLLDLITNDYIYISYLITIFKNN